MGGWVGFPPRCPTNGLVRGNGAAAGPVHATSARREAVHPCALDGKDAAGEPKATNGPPVHAPTALSPWGRGAGPQLAPVSTEGAATRHWEGTASAVTWGRSVIAWIPSAGCGTRVRGSARGVHEHHRAAEIGAHGQLFSGLLGSSRVLSDLKGLTRRRVP